MARITRKKINLNTESNIITGMIASSSFLRDVQIYFDYECLQNPISGIISSWCLNHYKQFEEAPKKLIQDIFLEHSKKGKIDPDHLDLIESFLMNLSDEFENADKFNHKYLLKKSKTYFSKQSLQNLSEDVLIHLKNGDIQKAEELQEKYKPIKDVEISGINPFTDHKAIRESFEEDSKPLFKIPGALGQMVNSDLCRESFMAFLGPEKIGKTWMLMEFVVRAYKARNNVAFFQAGDMSQSQQIRRMAIRHNKRSHKRKYCGNVKIPVLDCYHNQNDTCFNDDRENDSDMSEEDYTICTYCHKKKNYKKEFKAAIYLEEKHIKPLTWKESFRSTKKFDKRIKGKDFKLSTHSNDTLTVEGIQSTLAYWEEYSGFVPDVIVIDYADIMDEEKTNEFRHKENSKWKGLRALAQDKKCLVITATQADAKSYGKKKLGRENFTEDKRKFSHATSFYTLNRTEEEEGLGIIRVGQLFIRDDESAGGKFVTVLQSLQTGQAYIDSFWGELSDKIDETEEKENVTD